MKRTAPTRRSTWTCNEAQVISTITCVGRVLFRGADKRISYYKLYTVAVEFGTLVARVRRVPNAAALAWETELVRRAFIELGVIAP
jgi:hypothetical protein